MTLNSKHRALKYTPSKYQNTKSYSDKNPDASYLNKYPTTQQRSKVYHRSDNYSISNAHNFKDLNCVPLQIIIAFVGETRFLKVAFQTGINTVVHCLAFNWFAHQLARFSIFLGPQFPFQIYQKYFKRKFQKKWKL